MLDRLYYHMDMGKNLKRPRDANQLAKSIVDLTIGNTEETNPDDGKNPAAVALGRLGGFKGVTARAKKRSAKKDQIFLRKRLKPDGKTNHPTTNFNFLSCGRRFSKTIFVMSSKRSNASEKSFVE